MLGLELGKKGDGAANELLVDAIEDALCVVGSLGRESILSNGGASALGRAVRHRRKGNVVFEERNTTFEGPSGAANGTKYQ
jgi:hypothetical protein